MSRHSACQGAERRRVCVRLSRTPIIMPMFTLQTSQHYQQGALGEPCLSSIGPNVHSGPCDKTAGRTPRYHMAERLFTKLCRRQWHCSLYNLVIRGAWVEPGGFWAYSKYIVSISMDSILEKSLDSIVLPRATIITTGEKTDFSQGVYSKKHLNVFTVFHRSKKCHVIKNIIFVFTPFGKTRALFVLGNTNEQKKTSSPCILVWVSFYFSQYNC